jgi:hypothetical protein
VDQITRIFIDTSKSVFQLHGVNAAEAVVVRRKLRVPALRFAAAGMTGERLILLTRIRGLNRRERVQRRDFADITGL